MTTARERVTADAAARAIAIEFVKRPNAGSIEEAASTLTIRLGVTS